MHCPTCERNHGICQYCLRILLTELHREGTKASIKNLNDGDPSERYYQDGIYTGIRRAISKIKEVQGK